VSCPPNTLISAAAPERTQRLPGTDVAPGLTDTLQAAPLIRFCASPRPVATVGGLVRMWRQAGSIAVVAAFVIAVDLLVGWREALAPWTD
jgi:hypothetical protein